MRLISIGMLGTKNRKVESESEAIALTCLNAFLVEKEDVDKDDEAAVVD